MTNANVAYRLQEYARLLAQRQGNLFRARAYRRAAQTLLELDASVAEMPACDLCALPGIGQHLALVINHYARTGDWKSYEELTAANLAV